MTMKALVVCFLLFLGGVKALEVDPETCTYSIEDIGGYTVCAELTEGWEMSCCDFDVGACASDNETFIDHCVRFQLGVSPNCPTYYDCQSNILTLSDYRLAVQIVNGIRQQKTGVIDSIHPAGVLSDLALGHSAYWANFNASFSIEDSLIYQEGCPGDFCFDREAVVSSDLEFYLGQQYGQAACPEVFEYTELYFEVDDLDDLANCLRDDPDVVELLQSGRASATPSTVFMGLGIYQDIWDEKIAATIIWIETRATTPCNNRPSGHHSTTHTTLSGRRN